MGRGKGNFLKKGGGAPPRFPFPKPIGAEPTPPFPKTFMLIESLFTAFPRAAYSREWNIFPQTSQLNPAIRAFPRPRHRGPACGGISGHGEKRCSSLPAGACSFGLASERTPFVRPPHQSKVFEEEGMGFWEGEGKLSIESLPSPPHMFPQFPFISSSSLCRLSAYMEASANRKSPV